MEIIKYPFITEKATLSMEKNNTLQFLVGRNARKEQIKKAVEEMYNVKVVKVTTMITPKGEKKALVTLSPENSAEEIASRLGIF
ncbi:LSU ribosomal protein L23P [Methanocella conradii HZ254]|uniref:Large ribosomal subunit protein uL23 n=1 Tax=Methanocella conradii (strain DSM 24694 / JCM 17849 / CGMCC 1.5162 / HZ254) TaxID=1041930 RepID=H8IAI1_METCZ|nr:50S ribosomal protein L23 [Methanocella conradii]AFD00078.1 LSU ribosomal protein L23P [Methanocella conradii HZ254]MDI6896105.1 50S ribosomal protein L23 [Methanocella conradii]